jgi:hypothetical protein
MKSAEHDRTYIYLAAESYRQKPAYRAAHSRGTWLSFFGICLYLASQAFQIPIVALGPSWAVWPVLSDVAVAILLVGWLANSRFLRILSVPNQEVYSSLLLIFGATTAAFFVMNLPSMLQTIPQAEKSVEFGLFQIYRLAQFLLVFRIASGLPLTPKRVRILSVLAFVTLTAAFLGIVGTYTSVLPTPLLVSHLPSDKKIAGPWVTLSTGQWYEAGTIGYNHSYVAVQLVMLAGLALSLKPRRNVLFDVMCLLTSCLGAFLTASRAGLAAALFLMVTYLFKRPAALLLSVAAFGLIFLAFFNYLGNLDLGIAETVERHLTLQRPLDPENLSGRTDIWRNSLQFLMEQPVRWVIGAGPGAAARLGNNAHMLPLQIVLEGGIIGLILFGWTMFRMMARLYRFESGVKPVFLTTGALLISSATQETLYPVPSMGHFLGLFFCAVALALSIGSNRLVRDYVSTSVGVR